MSDIGVYPSRASSIQAESPTLLSVINSRLEHLTSRVIDANHDLAMLSDRAFGPAPATSKEAGPTSSHLPSMAESIHNWLDTLQTQINVNADLARGLNSRI